MTSVEEVLSNIDSKLRKRIRTGEGFKPERQALPSLTLTKALGGGMPYGRMVTVFGSKSAGKTSAMLQTIAMAQRDGKVCAWIDAEKCFDSEWAERLGVDTKRLIVMPASDMGAVGDTMVDLIKAGVDFIVVDSIGAMIPPSYMEKDGNNLAGMSKTAKIGGFATPFKALIKSTNYVNEKTLIVFISQTTTDMSGMHPVQKAEGGNATHYYSSQMIKLQSTNSSKYMLSETVTAGNRSYDRITGRVVNWEVVFNKVGAQKETGSYEFYFIGDAVGIDNRKELLFIALEAGIVERGGAWYTYGDVKLQGESNFIKWLDDPDNFKKLEKECGL